MSKKLTFIVTLEFENKITDDNDITELGANIAQSIKHTVDTVGITPDQCDTYATKIVVEPQFLPENKTVISII